MAIKNREELMKIVLDAVAHFPSDYETSLLEDVNDTLVDYEEKNGQAVEWENKYNELNNRWKEKYKERFVSSPKINNPNIEIFERGDESKVDDVTPENITIDDLFEQEGD